MLLFDTDHVSEYQRGTSAEAIRLSRRLAATTGPFGVTIISVEEIMRGWMAAIHRIRDPHSQIRAYDHSSDCFASSLPGASCPRTMRQHMSSID